MAPAAFEKKLFAFVYGFCGVTFGSGMYLSTASESGSNYCLYLRNSAGDCDRLRLSDQYHCIRGLHHHHSQLQLSRYGCVQWIGCVVSQLDEYDLFRLCVADTSEWDGRALRFCKAGTGDLYRPRIHKRPVLPSKVREPYLKY